MPPVRFVTEVVAEKGLLNFAEIENDRLRHIRLHERVNELPDANYATLKYFLGHLHRYGSLSDYLTKLTSIPRISQHSEDNHMSITNLSIVFGPTLLSPPPHTALATPNGPATPQQQINQLQLNGLSTPKTNGSTPPPQGSIPSNVSDNALWQNRAVETILEHFVDIFIDENEDGGAGGESIHDQQSVHSSQA